MTVGDSKSGGKAGKGFVGKERRSSKITEPQKPHSCCGGTWRCHMGLLCRHFPEFPDAEEGWVAVGCS